LVETLYYQTGGLPLLMNEILDTLQKRNLLHTENNELKLKEIDYLPIPENIRDLVTLQMDELTLKPEILAEIAASYGTEFSFGFLEKFTSTVNSIDELLEKGIIIEKSPALVPSGTHCTGKPSVRKLYGQNAKKYTTKLQKNWKNSKFHQQF
jgi:predicted ATPase